MSVGGQLASFKHSTFWRDHELGLFKLHGAKQVSINSVTLSLKIESLYQRKVKTMDQILIKARTLNAP